MIRERIGYGSGLVLLAGCMVCPPAAMGGSLAESYISGDRRQVGLVFGSDPYGLKGQAIFTLLPDNSTIEILLTNTTNGIPADPRFDNPSDQILSSLYFDLGGPGLMPGDPYIVGGAAYIAPGSGYVGPASKNTLGGSDDISGMWGYGNFKYAEPGLAFLAPNFLSTIEAHATLLAPGKLAGPEWGAISAANLLDAYDAGLPAISDTIRFLVELSQPLEDLSAIVSESNFRPYIEFGSDYEFYLADEPPSPAPTPVPELLTVLSLAVGVAGLGGYVRRRTVIA